MPLISIIVPVYNAEKYLHQCIDSILSQTFEDFELLLIDDGSTDNSGKICDEYASKDSRIRVFHQANQGQAKARNFGLDTAVGEWIVFVDSDDFIDLRMFEVLFSTATANNADIVMCNYYRFTNNEPSNPITENLPYPFLEEITAKNKFLYIIDNGELCIYHIVPWNKIFNKNIFDNVRFPEGQIYEDSTVAPYLLDSAKRIVCLKESYYFYRTNPQSTTQRSFSIKNFDYLLLYKDRIDYFLKHGKTEYASKISEDFFCFYIDNYFKINCVDKATKKKLYKFRSLAWKILPIYSKVKSVSLKQKISAVILLAFPGLFKTIFRR